MDLSDSDLDIDLEDSEVLRNLFDSKKSPSPKKSSAETAATSSKRSPSQKSKNETKEEVLSDLEQMPTQNLRLLLNANGLPVAGERPDLISRIKVHFGVGTGSSERKRGAALIEGTKSNH